MKYILILSLTFVFLSCSTQKCDPETSPAKISYLREDLYPVLKQHVAEFPTANSAAQKQDEKELFKMQKSRTEKDCERARSEVEVSLQSFYGKPYGQLDEKQVAALEPLFSKLRYEVGAYIGQVKRGYSRLRPYDYLSNLKPCVSKEKSLAYPSGHATLAEVYARVLQDIFPMQAASLNQRSREISRDRVLGGVHHPSDIESGHKMGEYLYAELLKSEMYKSDIEKYKKLFN